MDLKKLTRLKRIKTLEKNRHISLNNIAQVLVDEEENIHCENLVGGIVLPLGVAGPLTLNGKKVKGEFYLPLATTEGALVASVNRGCKAVGLSGGVNVSVYRAGVTRCPVFYTGSLKKSQTLTQWIMKNTLPLQHIAKKTSGHLILKKIEVKSLADYVFVRFYFDSQDAMGMNMATIATNRITEEIETKTGIKCLSLAGNFDIDKKPAWLNFINNRGFIGWGEAIIPGSVMQKILKTTAIKLFDVWLGKCMLGSAMSGSLGFNAHFANIIAAFFAATGQDLAHVVEGSQGLTTAKVLSNNSLYFSVYLPAIMLGTVGGGTKLITQTEARSIVGVTRSEELAEVLVGAVLAGELSLMASLAENSLAQAHQKLGR